MMETDVLVGKRTKGYLENSANQYQTPQNAVSDQGLHCLHFKTGISLKHSNNRK